MNIQAQIFNGPLKFYIIIGASAIYFLYHYFFKNKERKAIDTVISEQVKLKKSGEKIIVLYDELEIKSSSWKQEIEVGSGTRSRNEYIDVNQNYVYLEKAHRGHIFKQELIIDMEPEILRMKLAYKNKLNFYFNPSNLNEFYLDLDFLFI